jgi:peptidoglycan/xylan/chitin deacetylase (PgdA/CDA1 family)
VSALGGTWRRRAVPAAVALGAQYVPSVVALGQWTPLRVLPLDLCRWQGAGRGVAVTFDDGPDPTTTPVVLETLDRLGIKATFFMLGEEAAKHPSTVAEVLAAGHQVETHGYRHGHHLAHTPAWIVADLKAAVRTMEALDVVTRWYRPTFGQATGTTLVAARAMGLRPVLWSAWGREWNTSDPEEVAARLMRRLFPGAIVLLHDTDAHGAPGMWRTGLQALELVAPMLADGGLAPLTMDQLVR